MATEPAVTCQNCKKTLRHNQAYCPLFPPTGTITKWRECVCTIHTCAQRR